MLPYAVILCRIASKNTYEVSVLDGYGAIVVYQFEPVYYKALRLAEGYATVYGGQLADKTTEGE